MPSDTTYMQTEKTRGMNHGKPKMPMKMGDFAFNKSEQAAQKMKGALSEELGEMEPMEKPETGEAALAAAGYTGPEQRCQMCQHFEEPDQCAKYQAPADPEGHCKSFEAQGGEEEETEAPAQAPGAEEMEELK